MIKKIYSAVVLLALVAPAGASATEDAAEFHGLIELGVRGVDSNSNSAKFKEFRNMDDGVFGQVQLDAYKGDYFLQFDTENPGTDDQSFQLKGGEYGVFKYKFNYSEMLHNYTLDATTPATGIGTQHISFPDTTSPTTPPRSAWTPFDYKVAHKNYGGELEFSFHSPFYVNVGVERREQDGLRPFYVKQPAEVPAPISSTTDNLSLKGGYLGKSLSASITGSLSSFKNDYKYLLWDDPDPTANPATDVATLAPDNNYGKLAGDLSLRDLPLKSVLAVGTSYAHLSNSFTASDIALNSTVFSGATGFTSLNRTNFNGDIDYTSASIALTSNPMDKLDSKIFYRYLDRDDNSSVITYGSPTSLTSNADRLLSYKKNDVGIDLGYRLPGKTKLEAGYDYLKMDRSSPVEEVQPTESTKDNSVYIGIKNSSLDWVTAKLRYKHLKRDSAELQTAETTFYYMDQSYDEWKLGFDFSPVDSLDLGLSFAYKDTDYDQAIDTRQNDKRKNVYVDASWHMSKTATFNGFVGFEKVDTDANRTGYASTNMTYPAFTQTLNDSFWTYGLATNLAATDKLSFNLSWQYQKSDGQIDFDKAFFTDVANASDYTKKTLEAKAIYAIDPKLKMTVGYIYEKMDAADISTDNYQNILVAGSATVPSMYYYSGLFADPNYEANIGYVMLSYRF